MPFNHQKTSRGRLSLVEVGFHKIHNKWSFFTNYDNYNFKYVRKYPYKRYKRNNNSVFIKNNVKNKHIYIPSH